MGFALSACDKGEEEANLAEAKREAVTKVADADREADEKKVAAERELAEAQGCAAADPEPGGPRRAPSASNRECDVRDA